MRYSNKIMATLSKGNRKSKPLRLLLVDDEQEILDIIQNLLENHIHTQSLRIHTALSGNDAIEMLRNDFQFDLIVSDYTMGNGNGLTVLNYVLEKKIKSKFVFFTSSSGFKTPSPNENYLGIIDKTDLNSLVEYVHECI